MLISVLVTYASVYFLVPGVKAYTLEGFHALGLYEGRHEPGRHELVAGPDGPRLWGGPTDADHFDITPFRLDVDQLHYGLGRERFPALIEPHLIPIEDARALEADASVGLSLSADSRPPHTIDMTQSPKWPGDLARVLAIQVGDDVHIYPLAVIKSHEVVNDVVGGRPIFAAYCYLADLAAVFDRQYGEHVLTFAVSGYTYRDPDIWDGRDAFVLWDRDTESLWWPPLGKAVSRPLIDTPLRVFDESHWAQMTWGEAKAAYPNARVLAGRQDFEPPTSWPRLASLSGPTTRPTKAIPPRWGANPKIGR